MAKHPGKTAAQRRVLDEIGCGNHCPRMGPATRDAMLRAGLIEQRGELVLGRDRFGDITIPQFEMPIPVHIQWCEAMSSEGEDGE